MTMHQRSDRLLLGRAAGCAVPPAYLTEPVSRRLALTITRFGADGAAGREADCRWVRRLRDLAAKELSKWSQADADFIETAKLLVSELVTNAIRYGDASASMDFCLAIAKSRIVIAVNGGAQYQPQLTQVGDESETGRGLHIIALCAAAWGVGPDSMTTWCTLDLPVKESSAC